MLSNVAQSLNCLLSVMCLVLTQKCKKHYYETMFRRGGKGWSIQRNKTDTYFLLAPLPHPPKDILKFRDQILIRKDASI